ncbi:O-antigen/teichoic acid export membrane protein [Raoultella sp. BIGb0149]|uniref:flippase n=1 Tax=Raoultella sp. BIGb0149 TaxID=2485116 RepID=UPI0010DFF742|nr:flippase [Raoultella sp. BIGb0149]TDQ24892.1 O-antigen/teichoic acid export membrane protein [Raoultella sp. BIGb0149]
MNKRVLSNSVWMMAEKLISIIGLIFVTSYVAKYVGPNIFGQIALATSIFQITQIISQLGSDVIIFKRLSKNEKSGLNLLNSTTSLRAGIYLIISIPVFIFTVWQGGGSGVYFIFACFISCFFSSLDVYSIYYNAKLMSKNNTIINAFGLVLSLVLRWAIAALKLDPIYLCLPIALTGIVPFVIRFFIFNKNIKTKDIIKNKKYKKKYTKYLLVTGASFALSSISVAIYTRLSMLLLGFMDGSSVVGIYSVAVTLASSWSFVCQSFVTSSLPAIFAEKDQAATISKSAKLNLIVIIISLPMIVGGFFVGPWFIKVFYGVHYLDAFLPMMILNFATMCTSLGTVSGRYIAKLSGYAFLSKKMLLVTVISLCLNYALILSHGIVGAAIATLCTEVLSLTLLNYFFKKGEVFKVHKQTLMLNGFLSKKTK